MSAGSRLTYRIAVDDSDFEAIHRLNYKTFVDEIPQHPANPELRLVDKFHLENTYAICLDGEKLVGMVAGRATRPFSLDSKLIDLDSYLPQGHSVVEMRLLAVEGEYRRGTICCRLISLISRHFSDRGFDLGVISGSLRQLQLYKHIGCIPFGPIVGKSGAQFQPMYVTLEAIHMNAAVLLQHPTTESKAPCSFLPGPVEVRNDVRTAFQQPAVSHRSELFLSAFSTTQRLLCELTNARKVEILLGSGTLANDAVCAQISLLGQPGMVLSNGEFGERLVSHAASQQLDFGTIRADWGCEFDYDTVRLRLAEQPDLAWIWAVHCETSTGLLNNIDALKTIAADFGCHLCLDCISSTGTVPVDLTGVYLATCVSGKALASFSGLSMVFYDHDLIYAGGKLPRYLDLNYYAEQRGVPFTSSSNLVFALKASLENTCWEDKYIRTEAASESLRKQLTKAGFDIVAPGACASPAVITISLPPGAASRTIGRELSRAGYLLSYNSEYLLDRNWIQVCLMGEWSQEGLEKLPEVLGNLCCLGR